MTTTAVTSTNTAHPADKGGPLVSRQAWIWIALLAGSFIALHYHFIIRMYRIATSQWGGDWSHALAIPFIGIFYIVQNRDKLAVTPRSVCWWGLPLLFFGMFSYAFWIAPGRNDMGQGYSMIIGLFGLVLFILGPAMMRILWFPIAFLAFAVKISDRIWEQIAWNLQLLAARSAAFLLNIVGIEASVQGSTIELYQGLEFLGRLNVAEACSGLRMLMAFVALGVAMAFVFDRAWWQRLIMVLFTVPIALAVNVGRVTIMGVLYLVNPELTAGDFHKFVGLLMLLPALLLFLLLGWVLERIFLEDADAGRTAAANAGSVRPAGVANADLGATLPATPRYDWIAWGLGTGAVLTGLIGLAYGLGFASIRPDILDNVVSRPLAMSGFIVAVGVALGVAWAIRKRLLPGAMSPSLQMTLAVAVGAGVLTTAASGLVGLMKINNVILHKEMVELRDPLFRVPDRLGEWVIAGDDEVMNEEMLEALGTRQYLSRYYKNPTIEGPGSNLKLHIAYYTGKADSVPHVPDRCFIAAGLEFRGKAMLPMRLEGPAYGEGSDGSWTAASAIQANRAALRGDVSRRVLVPDKSLQATVFTFGPPRSPAQSNVVYFFIANGKFLASPDDVRMQGFDLRDRYAYYAKVEVGFFDVEDPVLAAERAEEFLKDAMPEILACLPDWQEVTRGEHTAK